MTRLVETVERIIPVPPEPIFALVGDPNRHQDIDGSGTVRTAKDVPEQIGLGSVFGMNMEFGGKYSMVSTVIEFEPGRRIAWQSRPAFGGGVLRRLVGGRIWRYELEPVEGGTRVRESWDLTQEKLNWLVWGLLRSKTKANIRATLERIEGLVTAETGTPGA